MNRTQVLRRRRVFRLIDAAKRIADPADPMGRKAREVLPASTGLSPEGVELALAQCFEVEPSSEELDEFCDRVPEAPRAHVLLSSNVFVGALRAIALAAAASPTVEVRPSRREPAMAAMLCEASAGAFELVEELGPLPGDHVWAYGTDATLSALVNDLPAGVVLHAHGSGLGAAVVQPPEDLGEEAEWTERVAAALAFDVALLDQRGCLSPRVVVCCDREHGKRFAAALARQLGRQEQLVPRGEVSAGERAAALRYRDTMLFVADVLVAGKGWVGLDTAGRSLVVPPVGRLVHVTASPDPAGALHPLEASLTTIGVAGPEALFSQLQAAYPGARVVPVGRMQRPRFDGPVDRRADPAGRIL